MSIRPEVEAFFIDSHLKQSNDAEIDFIFQTCNKWLHAGDHSIFEDVFEHLSNGYSHLEITIIISYLVITLPIKEKCINRKKFFKQIETSWNETLGKNRTGKLLIGLK